VPRPLPKLDPVAEAALLERARRGGRDLDAVVGELFRTYREPLLTLSVHVVGDRAEAEDVVQQVFVSVQRALPLFRGEARIATWLYRIAIRAALASRAARREAEPLDDALPGASAEASLLARDEALRVAEAMRKLPVEHRTVLSLFAIEGLSHREIADVLGVPEGTVWSRLANARRKLGEALRARG
jgi:RNA polymerase sigma-70 factor (ECF subfamily)